MAYNKYYSEGWKNNEDGNTPMTAAALNHMEDGIVAANVLASTTVAGLMSAQDKSKLNGIATGASVTGVKGSAQSNYQSGNVSLSATDVGALPSTTVYVSRVKGSANSSYKTGDVNLSPSDIGAVAKSGDTMTGVLRRSSNLDYDTVPAINESNEVLQALDADNHVRVRVYQGLNSNGTKYLYLMSRDDDGTGSMSDYNQLGIGLTSGGEPVFSLGSSQGNASKAFRKAISLGTDDGSLPIQVSQGGTGLTASPSILVDLSSTTAANVMQALPRPGITGTLPVGHGGSGLTASPSILVNLDSTSAANVFQSLPRPGVTGTLSIENGGTNAANATTARNNLNAAQYLHLDTASYSSIYTKLITNMEVNKATPFYAASDVVTYLTRNTTSGNGKINTSLKGVAFKDNNGVVSFLASTTTSGTQGHIFTFAINNITSTSLNCIAVYSYSGTAL